MNEIVKADAAEAGPIVPADVRNTPRLLGSNPWLDFGESGSNLWDGALLKFSKGDWIYGPDSDEVAPGSRFVPLMNTVKTGWVKWVGSRPVANRSGYLADGYVPLTREDLDARDAGQWETDNDGKPRDPWQETHSIVLVDADDSEAIFTFSSSSYGGRGALKELCLAYGKHARYEPGGLPVVELVVRSYQHKDKHVGRVKTPAFKIVDYADATKFEEALASLNGDPGVGMLPALAPALQRPKEPRPSPRPTEPF